MKMVDLFPASMTLLEVKARDKKSVIREMLQHLVAHGKLREDAIRKAERAVHKREGQGSTGIGKGLAIPHAKACPFVEGIQGVFARCGDGIPFDSVDGAHVHVLFLVLSSTDCAEEHLSIMRKIAMLHRDEKTLRFLATRADQDSVVEILKEIDDSN